MHGIRSRGERTHVFHRRSKGREEMAPQRDWVPAIIHRELRTLTTLRTYSWTLIQKGRRDWQCQGSGGLKRRGGGNRSARRVICIHVRCCLATWQPGRPSRPRAFSLPSPLPTPSRASHLVSGPRRAVRPAAPAWRMSPIDHFPRQPTTFQLAFPRPPCSAPLKFRPGIIRFYCFRGRARKQKDRCPRRRMNGVDGVCCRGGWTFRNRLL